MHKCGRNLSVYIQSSNLWTMITVWASKTKQLSKGWVKIRHTSKWRHVTEWDASTHCRTWITNAGSDIQISEHLKPKTKQCSCHHNTPYHHCVISLLKRRETTVVCPMRLFPNISQSQLVSRDCRPSWVCEAKWRMCYRWRQPDMTREHMLSDMTSTMAVACRLLFCILDLLFGSQKRNSLPAI